MANEEESNDMIVKAAICHHFTRAVAEMDPGVKLTPYMVKLAKAIVG